MGAIKTVLFGGEHLTEGQEKFRKIFMYLVCGGFTTVVNTVSFLVFDLLVTQEVNLSIFGYEFDLMVLLNQIIAWILAVVAAYVTNRIFVFRSSGSIIRELLSFAAARVVSFLVIELGIFSLMIAICESGFGIPKETAMFVIGSFSFTYLYLIKVLNSIFVVVANYVMSKIFVFKKEDLKDYGTKEVTEEA
ncbi:Putative flippase GtrA (transmembrane translocase of bactoprenol-linked glucose) [Ruminococcaceae bacterium YRB3002]|nr:Putative flippase GtrA (transmembrane translocase of bactoprenol-linked glucose) [Ruminococcaceae bacterium YRB3002]